MAKFQPLLLPIGKLSVPQFLVNGFGFRFQERRSWRWMMAFGSGKLGQECWMARRGGGATFFHPLPSHTRTFSTPHPTPALYALSHAPSSPYTSHVMHLPPIPRHALSWTCLCLLGVLLLSSDRDALLWCALGSVSTGMVFCSGRPYALLDLSVLWCFCLFGRVGLCVAESVVLLTRNSL